jgi:hypothetical protein
MAGRPRPRSHRAGWTAHERAAAARHVHAGLVGSHRRQERTMRGCPSGRRAAPRRTSRWHHPRPNTRSSPTTASRPEPTPSAASCSRPLCRWMPYAGHSHKSRPTTRNKRLVHSGARRTSYPTPRAAEHPVITDHRVPAGRPTPRRHHLFRSISSSSSEEARVADRRHKHTRDARPNASSPATPRRTRCCQHPRPSTKPPPNVQPSARRPTRPHRRSYVQRPPLCWRTPRR